MAQLTLSELFTKLTGREVKQSFGAEHMFYCPEHDDYKDGTGEPSLAINDQKDVGYCHSIACGWKFNRYQLLKWAGVPVSFSGVIYSNLGGNTVNKSPKAKKVADALCSSPLLWEKGNAVANCHTFVKQRKCLDCGELFDEKWTNSCGSALCPICRPRQIKRFIDSHRSSMVFYKGVKGISIKFPGKVLAKMNTDPVTGLQTIIKDAEGLLARLRRKIPVCRAHIRVVQVKLQNGIAFATLHILFDGSDNDAALVRRYFNERLPWRTANLARQFRSVGDALAWFQIKANEPLEFGKDYPTDRDIEIYAYAQAGKRLIQGAGRFYNISGGKGFDRASQEAKHAFVAGSSPVCPQCGSTRTVAAGIRVVSPRDRSPTEAKTEALRQPALCPV